MSRTAIVLLSGGMDSSTCLAWARAEGMDCHTLAFDYGQRHHAELAAAARMSTTLGARSHRVMRLDPQQFAGSALTDQQIAVPQSASTGIPSTYVPARNTIFLAMALGYAELMQADAIVIGVNAIDYSGYPDCRPAFIEAFRQVAALATRAAVEGRPTAILAPLQNLGKAEIARLGLSLGVDFAQTVTCYQADEQGRACGLCDACRLRRQGFVDAGLADPTRYD